jgi:hypothetical protein
MIDTAAWKFLHAGNSTITLVSTKTGRRFTYRVALARKTNRTPQARWFVRLHDGGEGVYIGWVDGTGRFCPKPEIEAQPAVRAFQWAYGRLHLWSEAGADIEPAALQVWHEGRCGRCGRALTVPESITTGLGPDCAKKVAHAH